MTTRRESEIAGDALRQLPSVHDLLSSSTLAKAIDQLGRMCVREAARGALDQAREQIVASDSIDVDCSMEAITARVVQLLGERRQVELRSVINATGIILHTGLGRAPLAQEAISAVSQAAGYTNVEIDLATGNRSQRAHCVEDDLRTLTGAETAHVVNNNAGATGLVIAALAAGREVVVSHGELIEIGGGFRLPEVFQAYGARLRAVGTTNRTRVEDYANAISSETGALMVIHASNYRVVGFTQQPDLKQLAELAKVRHIPLIHDIGSGALVEIASSWSGAEPIASESIAAGADLVLFSGDKLLGGPQCGVIVGKEALVSRLANHPMSRALRVDKLTLAALQATLAIYRRAGTECDQLMKIPFVRTLTTPLGALQERADRLRDRLAASTPDCRFEVVESVSYAGGGSLPGDELPSRAIAVAHQQLEPDALAHRLRTARPAVVARVHDGRLLLDLRCIAPEEDEQLYSTMHDTCNSAN